jgi:polyisoprenoid-binding protein YceI
VVLAATGAAADFPAMLPVARPSAPQRSHPVKPSKLSILLALLAVGVAAAAAAEPHSYAIDPAHSEIGFNIRHFFSKVHGRFNDHDGTIVYDPDHLESSSVGVTIRDSSIFTANERRDNDLRGENFFWVAQHPVITFKSTRVVPGADPDHFQVAGDLTIRGISKPVTLEVERLGIGRVAMGGRDMGLRAGFTATTTINRKDFGIVWNRALDQGGTMLGDDVQIVLNIEAVSRDPEQETP